MHVLWYGHAAFLVEADGKRIIFDPYQSPAAGSFAPIGEPADIVAVSHDNEKYHSHLGQIVPPFEVVRGPDIPSEGQTVQGLTFYQVPVFQSPEKTLTDAEVNTIMENIYAAVSAEGWEVR